MLGAQAERSANPHPDQAAPRGMTERLTFGEVEGLRQRPNYLGKPDPLVEIDPLRRRRAGTEAGGARPPPGLPGNRPWVRTRDGGRRREDPGRLRRQGAAQPGRGPGQGKEVRGHTGGRGRQKRCPRRNPVRAHGAEGVRTPDLCNANAALSQLSYSPRRAENIGVERASGQGRRQDTPLDVSPRKRMADG